MTAQTPKPEVVAPPSMATPTSSTATAPQIWVMWVNAALSWAFFPFAYLVYLTFRNISWARRNSLPWFKYLAPLLTVFAVTAAMTIWYIAQFVFVAAAMHSGGTTFTDPSGTGVLTGAKGQVAQPAPSPTVTAISANSPLGDRLSVADTLPQFKPLHGQASDKIDTILANFKELWQAASFGIDGQPAPQYLWGFMNDTHASLYTAYANDSSISRVQFFVTDPVADIQATRGATSRTYQVTLDFYGVAPEKTGTMHLKLVNDPKGTSYAHWMIMSLS